jgi:Rgg/GadR/MutR family transcriptional activator
MDIYGLYFKKLRKDRGFTLIETARGILSKSGLSKFERGTGDISLSKFFLLIEKIGVSMEEFEFYINGCSFNEYDILLRKIESAYVQQNTQMLCYLSELEDKRYKETGALRHMLISTMIKTVHDRISDTPITKKREIDCLIDYLFKQECWNYFELTIFGNCLSSLPVKLMSSLATDLIRKSHLFYKIPSNKKIILETLINSTIVCFEQGSFDQCLYILNSIPDFIEDTNYYGRYMYYFLKECIEMKLENKTESNKMIELLNLIEFLGTEDQIIRFRNFVTQNFK